jgi:hypothetical protein
MQRNVCEREREREREKREKGGVIKRMLQKKVRWAMEQSGVVGVQEVVVAVSRVW